MTTALEGGEGSGSRPGRSLPPGKIRYPLCRRLVGPQGRSGQVRKISPPLGFDPRTVQPVSSRYTDYATRPTYLVSSPEKSCRGVALITDSHLAPMLQQGHCYSSTPRMGFHGPFYGKLYLLKLFHNMLRQAVRAPEFWNSQFSWKSGTWRL